MKHDHPLFLILAGLALSCVFYLWASLLMATEGPYFAPGGMITQGGTDTDVGCLDDCLEPATIQDEADTKLSKERN